MTELIKQIEEIFGFPFEGKRRDILLDFSGSFQVQACPGSGKTTLLVAKLIALSQLIDFEKDAICVLTHTNVAVEEIRLKIDKLKNYPDQKFIKNILKLFAYPNFIGTTQSFLDRYLGIPEYVKLYHKRPNFIGDEFLEGIGREIQYNVLNDTLEIPPHLKRLNGNIGVFNMKKYIQIQNFGKLSYKEIDYFSLKHIQESSLTKELIQERFTYTFIDELQDTSGLHISILNQLFAGGSNVIQGFGDYNQAILEDEGSEELTIFGKEVKSIDESRRLSSIIAGNVKNIAISPQELTGIEGRAIPIYILLFDEKNINMVVCKFQEIIESHTIGRDFIDIPEEKRIFKAVGWVHNNDGKGISVCSYWDQYDNGKQKKKREKLFDYFQKMDGETYRKFGFRLYKDTIIDGFIHAFNYNKDNQIRKADGKSFSRFTLIEYLKESKLYEDFNLRIFTWINAILSETLDWNNVKEYILSLEINGSKLIDSKFLSEMTMAGLTNYGGNTDNTLNKIKFSTIHSVKGETHTGTLLLDTDYSNQNTSKILEYWNIEATKENEKVYDKKGLRIHYVGITRATHLLCIALRKSKWHEKFRSLLKEGEIILLEI